MMAPLTSVARRPSSTFTKARYAAIPMLGTSYALSSKGGLPSHSVTGCCRGGGHQGPFQEQQQQSAGLSAAALGTIVRTESILPFAGQPRHGLLRPACWSCWLSKRSSRPVSLPLIILSVTGPRCWRRGPILSLV